MWQRNLFFGTLPRHAHARNAYNDLLTKMSNHTSQLRLKAQRSTMTNSEDIIESCKASAAQAVVDDNVRGDCVLGIGSGSTMPYVLERLAQLCREKSFAVQCIPTSFQAKQLIHDFNFRITDLDSHPVIDVTIDGADEVDKNLVAIKGGGACLAQEKVVASAAKRFVVVADYRKNSDHLGQNWSRGIPIEVLPMAWNSVRHHIVRTFTGAKLDQILIRVGTDKAGPVITDNGNIVLDWKLDFNSLGDPTSSDWKNISDRIKLIPGVVETGIFAGMLKAAYYGGSDGQVIVIGDK